MSDAPDLPDPDLLPIRVAHLRKRARRALDAAGIKVGGDHLIDPIVAALQAECRAQRDLFASVVMTIQSVDAADPLESVLMSIRQGYLDQNGDVQLHLPPGDE